MAYFYKHNVNSGLEESAKQLRLARKNQNISLDQAAAKTGIRVKYLKALEEADINSLPPGLYGRNYLKEYALFLGLDPLPHVGTYDFETSDSSSCQRNIFIKKSKNPYFSLTIPNLIRAAAIMILVILAVLYLAFYLRNLTAAPYLQITYPDTDISTTSLSLLIKGKTETETKVFINNETVLINDEGYFKQEIDLKKGLNIITVTSQKTYGRIAELSRIIIVE